MSNKLSEDRWIDDFKEFIETANTPLPSKVSQKIIKRVYTDLNPSALTVFIKLLGIHSVVGTLSLLVCDQFGLNPFQTGFSLSKYFMAFGHSFCMTLCGVLFLSISLLLARFVFSREELNVLKKNSFVQIFALASLSLAVFAILGTNIALSIAFLWLLGALLGGLIPILI